MVGNGELADVVEQRAGVERLYFIRRQIERRADADGVNLRAANVSDADLVARVNRRCERLDRRQMHAARFGDFPRFLSQTIVVNSIGEMTENRYGQNNEAERQAEFEKREVKNKSRGDGNNIRPNRPEKIFLPNLRGC